MAIQGPSRKKNIILELGPLRLLPRRSSFGSFHLEFAAFDFDIVHSPASLGRSLPKWYELDSFLWLTYLCLLTHPLVGAELRRNPNTA